MLKGLRSHPTVPFRNSHLLCHATMIFAFSKWILSREREIENLNLTTLLHFVISLTFTHGKQQDRQTIMSIEISDLSEKTDQVAQKSYWDWQHYIYFLEFFKGWIGVEKLTRLHVVSFLSLYWITWTIMSRWLHFSRFQRSLLFRSTANYLIVSWRCEIHPKSNICNE